MTRTAGITAIEERLDEIRAELENLNAAHEGQRFPDETREHWNDLVDEKAKLEVDLKETRKRHELLVQNAGNPRAMERSSTEVTVTGQHVEMGPSPSSSSASRNGIPALMPDDDQVRRLHRAVTLGQSLRTEIRAVVTSALTGADQVAQPAMMRGRRERRIATAAGLQSENVAGVTSVEFPVFGSDVAAITAEGVAKAEFDSITPGSATPQVIAAWTDTTRQNILTMTSFEAKLRSVLSSRVALREDQLLIDTVLATAGVVTVPSTPITADAILEQASVIAAGDVAAEPNLVAVNPANVPDLLGTTVGAGGTASPPFAQFLPTIHGLIVYPTNHIPLDEVLIGAWPESSHYVIGISPVVLVDSMSGIKTNTVTILLEEAVAIAVDEPAGFLHVQAAV